MHAKLDLVLGLAIHQAYCAILYQRASNVGTAGTCVWFRRFYERLVLMLFAIAVAAGKPFRLRSVS